MRLSKVFSSVSYIAAVHAMQSLKKTGTEFHSAKGMSPKKVYNVTLHAFSQQACAVLLIGATGCYKIRLPSRPKLVEI